MCVKLFQQVRLKNLFIFKSIPSLTSRFKTQDHTLYQYQWMCVAGFLSAGFSLPLSNESALPSLSNQQPPNTTTHVVGTGAAAARGLAAALAKASPSSLSGKGGGGLDPALEHNMDVLSVQAVYQAGLGYVACPKV